MQSGDPALRKRQQIAKANRMMFMWIAGASVIVGVAAVLSVFLFQKLVFNEKILSKKQETVNTLIANNKVVGDLKDNIRVLNTNQALLDSRASADNTALQAILDALPSDANSSALGSSLQNVLLPGENITLESLTVNPVGGMEGTADDSGSSSLSGDALSTIGFSFTVNVPVDKADSLRDLLLRLERSIRAIDIKTATIETQGSRISLSVTADAFYELAKTIDLKTEIISPKQKAKR